MSKKILVVDDDPDFLEQTSMVLEADGYDIVTATSREEAEDMIMSVQPDLSVVDLMMESMDSGFVLCHNIKRLYPNSPVIMLTAVRSATGLDFTAQNQAAGAWIEADAFLDKPVRAEQLRGEVKRLLSEHT